MTPTWQGVYPAATTQFKEDLSIDLAQSQRVIDNLVKYGVHGIIAMGTCGEPASNARARWCAPSTPTRRTFTSP